MRRSTPLSFRGRPSVGHNVDRAMLLVRPLALLSLVALTSCSRFGKDDKSVLFVGEARVAGRSPSGEPMGFSKAVDRTILVEGKDESAKGDLRVLPAGTRVKLIVTAAFEGSTEVRCEIVLPGLRRTLVQGQGSERAVCEGTIPR